MRVAVAVDRDPEPAHVGQARERLLAVVGERERLEHRVPHEDVLHGRLVEHLARGRERAKRGVGVDEAGRQEGVRAEHRVGLEPAVHGGGERGVPGPRGGEEERLVGALRGRRESLEERRGPGEVPVGAERLYQMVLVRRRSARERREAPEARPPRPPGPERAVGQVEEGGVRRGGGGHGDGAGAGAEAADGEEGLQRAAARGIFQGVGWVGARTEQRVERRRRRNERKGQRRA